MGGCDDGIPVLERRLSRLEVNLGRLDLSSEGGVLVHRVAKLASRVHHPPIAILSQVEGQAQDVPR